MSVREFATTILIALFCFAVITLTWKLEDAERELGLARGEISVLALENAGLEAQITREALRAYCQVECGSCTLPELLSKWNTPLTDRGRMIASMSNAEYEAFKRERGIE